MTDRTSQSPLTAAQRQLVVDQQGFVRKLTRFHTRKYRGFLAGEEVRQIIQLALTQAARVFDPARGVAFTSFAWPRIGGSLVEAARGEAASRDPVRRALAACGDLQSGEVDFDEDAAAVCVRAAALAARLATAAAMGLAGLVASAAASGGESGEAAAEPEGEAATLAAELRQVVQRGVAALPERGRRVVALYYEEGRTLRDVADVLGVSYATVRRDHDEALDALRTGCVRAGFDGRE